MQWGGLLIGLAGVALILHDRPMGGRPAGAGLRRRYRWSASRSARSTSGAIAADRLAQRQPRAICRGDRVLFDRRFPVRDRVVHWTTEFILALAWLAVALSIGSIGLLYWLIRHQAATSVASLFYLVPAVTSLMAFVLFDERLDAVAIAGMIACAAAVLLVNRNVPAKSNCRGSSRKPLARVRGPPCGRRSDADRSCRVRCPRLQVQAASRSRADGSAYRAFAPAPAPSA